MAKRRYHKPMMDSMRGHMTEHMGNPGFHSAEAEHDAEARAMYRLGQRNGPEYYAGAEPRRRQEMRDANMIHEDHRSVANLPQYVIQKTYSDAGGYLPEDLDDTIGGVDRQMNYDSNRRNHGFYPKKV